MGHVLGIASVLRVIWIALCPNEPTSDQVIYAFSGQSIANGLGYIDQAGNPANIWPVGYPAMVALPFALFGPSHLGPYFLNLLFWLVAIAGVYALGRDLWGKAAAALAGLLVAVHPTFVMLTTEYTSETPFIAGELWIAWLLLQTLQRPATWYRTGLPAGLLIGLMVYVRPTAQVFLAAFPLLSFAWRWMWRPRLLATVTIALVAFMVLIPWGIRNQSAFGTFAVTSTNGGANLWMGNNPASDGLYTPPPADLGTLGLVERDRELGRRALSYIAKNPIHFLVLCLRRTYLSFRSDTIGVVWNEVGITRVLGARTLLPLKALTSAFHYAMLIAMAMALRRTRATWSRADLLVLTFVMLNAIPMVLIVGGNRYMLPMVPFFILWVASSLRVAQSLEHPR